MRLCHLLVGVVGRQYRALQPHRATGGQPTSPLRERDRISERLSRLTDRLARLRGEARVLAEQVDYLTSVADDARIRQAVASNPVADRDWHAAERDLTNHRRLLDETRDRITQLESERDTLLERLFDLEDDT